MRDKESPLSAATNRSFSFARSVAIPLPPLPPSPPRTAASSPPFHPMRRCPPSLPPPRLCLSLTCLLVVASLLTLSLRSLLPHLFQQSEGYTFASYLSAHPLPASLSPLPASSDHTLSPSLPTPTPTPSPSPSPTPSHPHTLPLSLKATNFVSRSTHLDQLAEKKRAAAAKRAKEEVEEVVAGWRVAVRGEVGGGVGGGVEGERRREEVREVEARRMLVRLKKVMAETRAGREGAEGQRAEGRGAAARRPAQPDVVDVDDTLPLWSKVRLRGDKQVLALQRRPTVQR